MLLAVAGYLHTSAYSQGICVIEELVLNALRGALSKLQGTTQPHSTRVVNVLQA